MCMDDLQWCHSEMLVLIKEIIMSVGQNKEERQHFLFIGMYRHDEIDETHPLAEQLTALKNNSDVHVTEIELSSFSSEDVSNIIMSETRLPRRLVWRLADIVHKKSGGHALFVVQFLNSLVRDSTIAYSPRSRRFDWDESEIAALRTWVSENRVSDELLNFAWEIEVEWNGLLLHIFLKISNSISHSISIFIQFSI